MCISFRFTSPEYVPEFKNRLRLLRPNSDKLALFKPSEMFEALTKWDKMLHDLNNILEAGQNTHQGLLLRVNGQKSICHYGSNSGGHPSCSVSFYLFVL